MKTRDNDLGQMSTGGSAMIDGRKRGEGSEIERGGELESGSCVHTSQSVPRPPSPTPSNDAECLSHDKRVVALVKEVAYALPP